MMLGDLIAQLDDEATAVETLLATGDIGLVARVQAAAEAAGSSLGELLQELIGSFGRTAGSSDWIAVMNAAGRSEAPGAACLRVMLGVALAAQETTHGPVPATS